MNNKVSELKSKYEKYYLKKFYNLDSFDKCSNANMQIIRIAAEIKSYMKTVIPQSPVDYSQFNIANFTGKKKDDKEYIFILDPEAVKKAKIGIANYCWGITDYSSLCELEKDQKKLDNMSLMDIRLKRGSSLTIYSNEKIVPRESSNFNDIDFTQKPRGRTFAASLIMKEAIKRRAFKGNISKTYGWISFNQLMSMLQNKEEEKLMKYRYCDWLVIDDIPPVADISDRHCLYRTSLFDPFFQDRVDMQIPTILVLKFNPINNANLEKQFGTVFRKIVFDNNNFKIEIG